MSALDQTYDANFYANQKAGSLASAQRVLAALRPALGPIHSVLDVGCGAGGWLRTAEDVLGAAEIAGVDHPGVPRDQMFIHPKHFEGRDLQAPFDLGRRFDLVICLEVAEHLPAEKAASFVDTLTRHARTVLFSAAIPRQGGSGHVNEQWPNYWAELFRARGFALHDVVRPLIWEMDDVASWYAQNAMLYAGPEARLAVEGLADWGGRPLVHPGSWMRKTEPPLDALRRVMAGRKPTHAWR